MRKPRKPVVEFDPTNPDAFEEETALDRQEQKTADELKRDDFLKLMRCDWGRRIADRLLGDTHVFATSFTGEAQTTAFQEGERNIGLKWMALINEHAIDEFVLMMKERDV